MKQIEVYKYQIRKNGTAVKDSTLILSQILDRRFNIISGIQYQPMFTVSSGEESPYFIEYTEKYLGDKIISISEGPHNAAPFKGKKYLSYNYYTLAENYTYDENGNLVKFDRTTPMHDIMIDKKNRDTLFHLKTIKPETQEYIYDKNNRVISKFISTDSLKTTVYENSKFKSRESHCDDCSSRYKSIDYEYNESGFIKRKIKYEINGEIKTRIDYYYKDNYKISEIVLSPSQLEKTTSFEYKGSEMTETVKDYSYTIVKKYNSENLLIEDCTQFEDEPKRCEYYDYTLENHRITAIVHTDNETRKINPYFKYNSAGLIIEEKDIVNDKIVDLIRYYYK
ncbi:hypothetical protein [Flavobacterium sp.]|uniref:hypothetical protein n=1 Tax=Flavobacterium sp. TaxID=239 RepID=UPI004034D933